MTAIPGKESGSRRSAPPRVQFRPTGRDFERLFLTPMYHGKIDRPVEYGILVTK
jgi:hypothetical protein